MSQRVGKTGIFLTYFKLGVIFIHNTAKSGGRIRNSTRLQCPYIVKMTEAFTIPSLSTIVVLYFAINVNSCT